jgi:hypothetical protein
VFSSGCHSFWRNDLSQLLFELISGVILFGSMRSMRSMEKNLKKSLLTAISASNVKEHGE